MASYVWTLSGGCVTPTTERYLLWELPLKRGWQYYHADLLQREVRTVSRVDSKVDKYHQLAQHVAAKAKTIRR